MGKYHPHGNSAIYDALARMTQPWSMRVPLIDGQGNFGSMDPDPPAGRNATPKRVWNGWRRPCWPTSTRIRSIFRTITTAPSASRRCCPHVTPTLLVNGAGGIAVGMATNVPPHNLGEVIDACFAYIDNPAITSEELIEYIPGPDFPTAPLILGTPRRAVGLHHRTRVDPDALPPRDRDRPQRPAEHRIHLDPLSGRQE